VTSPPYFGLRSYGTEPVTWADGWTGELGQEPTSEQFIHHLVEIAAEVHRVLRDDGTFWLNIGDTYNSYNGNRGASQGVRKRSDPGRQKRPKGAGLTDPTIKHKNLMLVPGRLAKALQDAGWYVRNDAIWSKAGGNCPRCYYRIERGNTIPESAGDRFTRAHEYVWVLSKKDRGYFFDVEAVKDEGQTSRRRDVFHLTTQSFRGAHYAVMPEALADLAVRGATSAHGCCGSCAAPFKRVTKKGAELRKQQLAAGSNAAGDYTGTAQKDYDTHQAQDPSATKARILAGMKKIVTVGWTQTCKCENPSVVPATVLDPFSGAATTGVVTLKRGHHYVGIDLVEKNNAEIATPRLEATLAGLRAPDEIAYLQEGLHHGDALKLLHEVAPGSVRLVLTDPPYNTSRENNFATMGREGIDFDWDGDFDQEEWVRAADKALMPWGSIVIWNDWKNLGILAHLLMDLGYDVKRNMTWVKSNPMPRNTERSPVQAVEVGLWAVKPGTGNVKWVFNPKPPYETFVYHYPSPRPKQGRPRHQTKKPDELFMDLISTLTNPGELVLDPFSGGGTTVYAATRLGRRYMAFELHPDWYAESRRRLVEDVHPLEALAAVSFEEEPEIGETLTAPTRTVRISRG